MVSLSGVTTSVLTDCPTAMKWTSSGACDVEVDSGVAVAGGVSVDEESAEVDVRLDDVAWLCSDVGTVSWSAGDDVAASVDVFVCGVVSLPQPAKSTITNTTTTVHLSRSMICRHSQPSEIGVANRPAPV
jgi:hypothetical protein